MPSIARMLLSLSLTASLVACGGDDDDGDTSIPDAREAETVDAAGVVPDAQAGDFTTLITGTWSKEPGSDSYWCSYLTLTEDVYITGLEAIAPPGTHHTVLSVSDSYNGPDTETACDVSTIAEQLIYASGVGTDPYELPEGVAIKVEAGQTLQLQLHLYNASDTTLTGTSGTRVKLTSAEEVEHEAEFVFAGTFSFAIPGNGVDYSAGGNCTIQDAGTIFTLWPHMHQIGNHMTIRHNGELKLDEPYSFDEQKLYPIDPFTVAPGDTIGVECTWNNPQGNPTRFFGDASGDEMCFGGFYRYPAVGSAGFCTN